MTDLLKKWQDNLPEELAFWKNWLNQDDLLTKQEGRITLVEKAFPFSYLVSLPVGSTIKVLDVGSGPITTVGTVMTGYNIELTTCDPLAEHYNELLRKIGMPERATNQQGDGESLTQIFPENTFDFVHSANALDHSYDPLLCIQNMLAVCKPNGWVIVITIQNEGERENYQGLHQWNFSLENNNQVRLWTKNQEKNLLLQENLKGIQQFKAYPVDHGTNIPIFTIEFQKAASAD